MGKKKTSRVAILNRRGEEVPITSISPIALKRNDMVEAVVTNAKKLASEYEKKKQTLIEKPIFAYINFIESEHEVKLLTEKGNLTLFNHSQTMKIVIANPDQVRFNEQLLQGIKLIRDLLKEWVAGGRSELQAILNELVRMDREGNVSHSHILQILKIQSDEPQWKKAIEILRASIEIIGAKQYIRLYEKDPKGNWQFIRV